MRKTTRTIKINAGGTLFETTKGTLDMSPVLRCLLKYRDADSDEPLFIDEDPDIFKEILNRLRNPEYAVPYRHRSRLNFYGIEESEMESYVEFYKPVDRPFQILTLQDSDRLAVIPGSSSDLNFAFIQLAAVGRREQCLNLPHHRAFSTAVLPFLATEMCVVPRFADEIDKVFIHHQFALPKMTKQLRFDDIYTRISFLCNDNVVCSITGKELDILMNFMRLKYEFTLTQCDGIYDIRFQVPLSIISDVNHKNFHVRCKKEPHGLMICALPFPKMALSVEYKTAVSHVSGCFLLRGILYENAAREKLISSYERRTCRLWTVGTHSWEQKSEHIENVRVSALVPEMYIHIAKKDDGCAVDVSTISLSVNGMTKQFYGYLLEKRDNIYKVDFEDTLLNTARIDCMQVKVTIWTKCTVICTLVYVDINEFVYDGGSACTRFS